MIHILIIKASTYLEIEFLNVDKAGCLNRLSLCLVFNNGKGSSDLLAS